MDHPIPTEPLPDSAETIMAAVAHGMTGNPQAGLTMLQPFFLQGPPAMVSLCGALAELVAMEARHQHPDADGFGLLALQDGRPADSRELPAGERFAAQFTAAWLNRDQETAYALFRAVHEGGRDEDAEALANGVWALYETAVAAMRKFTSRNR